LDLEDMELRRAFVELDHSDGTLGWDILRRMRVELDFAREEILLHYRSEPPPVLDQPNLVWAPGELPQVRLLAEDGTPTLFSLDTGATWTRLHSRIHNLLTLDVDDTWEGQFDGIGPPRVCKMELIRYFTLFLGNQRLLFPRIVVVPPGTQVWMWPRSSGTLGIDCAADRTMVIDLPRGEFALSSGAED
jgi:hypothetical protein